MRNPLDFSGRSILVTGASSGIGRATSVLLSSLKARVILAGRDRPRLEATLASLEGDGHSVAPFDLAQMDDIGGWIKELVKNGEPLAGLAHCAGVHLAAPLSVLNPRRIEDLLQLNVTVPLLLARAFRQKGCCARDSGIVFVSSAAGRVGSPGLALYGSSKAALIGLTKNLAIELARERIRVNCVTAGLVQTEMTERLRSALTPEQFQAAVDEHPLGLGAASDVANAIAFLLSGAARWITGSELVVDGGYTAR